uniref:Uncharacterized protein n=1 Tax=Candidatus Kentrum sp. LFY TaxID=2126342 RepID=A0A450WIQ4_9GAMM|nr:MAG: hypothetical protein BECKLFY1418C_GA0070996_10276 [Candidatus Kentron sp. LFY]
MKSRGYNSVINISAVAIAVSIAFAATFSSFAVVTVSIITIVGFIIAITLAPPAGSPVSIAFASTFGVVGSCSLTALSIFAAANSFVLTLIVIGYSIGIITVIRLSAWLRERFHSRRGIIGYWLGFNLLSISYAVLALIVALPRIPDAGLTGVLLFPLFLAILPLVNAALDWVSLGVTRGLLYAIRRGHHTGLTALGWVFADIVLAIFFLCTIASLVTLLLSGINAATIAWGGGLLLDLGSLFDELASNPASIDFIWIHFMMISTLIPTLVHFLIAGFSVVFVLPDGWRQWIVQNTNVNEDARLLAFLYVSFMPLLALALPAGLLWSLYILVSMHHGVLAMGLLEWTRGIAMVVDPSMT